MHFRLVLSGVSVYPLHRNLQALELPSLVLAGLQFIHPASQVVALTYLDMFRHLGTRVTLYVQPYPYTPLTLPPN